MFKFNFGDAAESEKAPEPAPVVSSDPPTVLPHLQTLDLLKSTAPRVSYGLIDLGSVTLPRRDLFDVRFQLMGEDKITAEEKLLLGNEDVRKSVYEGGLKIWEGSIDLAQYLEQNAINKHSVLELGCGAAIPGCYMLYQLLKTNTTNAKIVLADYNVGVLRLVTMPNIVLTWLAALGRLVPDEHEVNLTAELINEMEQDLQSRKIELSFVSGAWSPEFSQLIGDHAFDLVLASETIYSPATVGHFTDVMRRSLSPSGYALVSAKRVYFGVGGTVADFEKLLDSHSLAYKTVSQAGDVGRVILSVNTSS